MQGTLKKELACRAHVNTTLFFQQVNSPLRTWIQHHTQSQLEDKQLEANRHAMWSVWHYINSARSTTYKIPGKSLQSEAFLKAHPMWGKTPISSTQGTGFYHLHSKKIKLRSWWHGSDRYIPLRQLSPASSCSPNIGCSKPFDIIHHQHRLSPFSNACTHKWLPVLIT